MIGGDTQDNEHYLCSWISFHSSLDFSCHTTETKHVPMQLPCQEFTIIYIYIYVYYVAKKMDVYYQYPKNMVPNVLLNSVNKHCHCQRINGSRYVESFGIWGFLKTIEERIAGGTNRPLVLRRTHIMDGNN